MRAAVGLVIALALGGMATLVAQGNQANGQSMGTQPVGSLTIPSLSIANAPIYGFGFSLKVPYDSSGGGRADFSTIDLVRAPDVASTGLLATAASGRHVPEVRIVVETPTPNGDDSIYRLSDVIITKLANDNGVERLSIAYGRIEIHTGSGNFCYDVAGSKSC